MHIITQPHLHIAREASTGKRGSDGHSENAKSDCVRRWRCISAGVSAAAEMTCTCTRGSLRSCKAMGPCWPSTWAAASSPTEVHTEYTLTTFSNSHSCTLTTQSYTEYSTHWLHIVIQQHTDYTWGTHWLHSNTQSTHQLHTIIHRAHTDYTQ